MLPVEYRLDVAGDEFLARWAFGSARHRYDCAESMIGASFGGTVIGAIARSLFVDGLRWIWIAESPDRRRNLLGELLAERNRLSILLERTGASCPILPRWLMPLPDVADLTGQSMSWLDVAPLPGEDGLIEDFLSLGVSGTSGLANLPDGDVPISRISSLLNMSGLRGAVMILAHAGHGNYLGLQSSLSDDGGVGHDLRADHEALFMQVAAVGVTATLVGATTSLPQSWPPEIDREVFLGRAVDLAAEVERSAVAIHRLTSAGNAGARRARGRAPAQRDELLRPAAVLTSADLLPDVNSAAKVVEAAEEFYAVAKGFDIRPWEDGDPALHSVLTWGGGWSNLEAVMSTYRDPGSAIIGTFAARMSLEEAARLAWRFSISDPESFKRRAKQYFDEYRARQRRTINLLVSSGVSRPVAESIFTKPRNVRVITPDDQIARSRQPLPTISSMLRDFGRSYAEPGWLEVAYSILSQITHSTQLGQLHTMRYRGDGWSGGELSTEMLALTLDIICLSSACLLGLSALVLTDLRDDSVEYHRRISQQAASVHARAQLVHGLD